MAGVDVEFVEELNTDIHNLRALQAEYPDVFGGDSRTLRLIYCCLYHKAIHEHDGPRKLQPETLTNPLMPYYDDALRLSHDDVKKIVGQNMEIEHQGKRLDAKFVGHKIVNGRVLALAVCKADTPERAEIANDIGPDKKYKGVSISASWEVSKGNVIDKPMIAHPTAVTKDPFYPTYIYYAASKESADLGMHAISCGFLL